MDENGFLKHSYNNKISKIDGFLEDYSLLASAFISLYELTGEEIYLQDANRLVQKTFDLFYNSKQKIFFFNQDDDNLISRSIEIHDNVIPASNSVMANNLFKLGHLLGNTDYLSTSKNMLLKVIGGLEQYPTGYSNWALLMLSMVDDYFEIVVSGKNAKQTAIKLQQEYLPNCLFSFSEDANELPLFKNRFAPNETRIYVCQDNACKLPVKEITDALKLIQQE